MTSSTELYQHVATNRPTRIRYWVVGLTIVLGMVTYLDRVCISTLRPFIMRDLRLSDMEMGYVFSAFALSYTLLAIPVARWTDRVGTRWALSAIVVWWSTFTMATAAGVNLVSMVAIRFLFGAGEAGAWPAVARTFSRWIPYRERGTAQGIFFIGAHGVAGLTPLLVLWMAGFMDWRTIFIVFGLLGFAWVATWYLWFRDDPSQHRQVNAAELQLIAGDAPTTCASAPSGTPALDWRRLLTDRNVLALCLMYVPNSFAFYFCITWLPAYLEQKHDITGMKLGILAGLPLVMSVAADVLGGVTTDWAVRRFGPRLGRAGVGLAAYLAAGGGMLFAAWSTQPILAATWIALATAASMFMLGAAWSTCQDIGGPHTGVVSALMNTAGQLGSVACPLLVIYVKTRFADWNAPLILIGVLFLLGMPFWCFIDPQRQIGR